MLTSQTALKRMLVFSQICIASRLYIVAFHTMLCSKQRDPGTLFSNTKGFQRCGYAMEFKNCKSTSNSVVDSNSCFRRCLNIVFKGTAMQHNTYTHTSKVWAPVTHPSVEGIKNFFLSSTVTFHWTPTGSYHRKQVLLVMSGSEVCSYGLKKYTAGWQSLDVWTWLELLPALISWENLKSTTGELSSSSTCWTNRDKPQDSGRTHRGRPVSIKIARCTSCQHWKPFWRVWCNNIWPPCSWRRVRAVQKRWNTAWCGTVVFIDIDLEDNTIHIINNT